MTRACAPGAPASALKSPPPHDRAGRLAAIVRGEGGPDHRRQPRHWRGLRARVCRRWGGLVAQLGQECATTYASTKGALSAFTRALAIDEARHGVRVNAILPGNVATSAYEQTIANSADPAAIRGLLESWQWLGRPGTP